MLFEKPFEEISKTDILDLIKTKTIEQKTLEYKESLPDSTDKSKDNFLSTVAAFANSSGGLIIYGLRENNNGEASEIVNIETSSIDADFRRLLHIIQTGIEPRIIPPEVRPIKIDEKKIYLMKILPSFNKPHRVKESRKFHGRRANGKYELDVGEIKNLFLSSSTLEEKFENFKMKRLIKIKSGDFPFVYYSQNIVTLHIASLSSLSNNVPISLKNIVSSNTIYFYPLYSTGYNKIYNFDGLMNYYSDTDRKVFSYTQIFRNGIIETSNFKLLDPYDDGKIHGVGVEKEIRVTIDDYISKLQKIGIDFPYFISISMLNTKGRRIVSNNMITIQMIRDAWGDFGAIYDNDLILPTVYIENKDELPERLCYCFDVFWNADGYDVSPVQAAGI